MLAMIFVDDDDEFETGSEPLVFELSLGTIDDILQIFVKPRV